MVKISNIKWKHEKFVHMNSLKELLVKRLTALNLQPKIELKVTDEKETVIYFNEVDKNKVIYSRIDNYVKMSPDDKRIKKVGRNYLLTNKPNEKQYHGFFNIINTTLNELGLSADVIMTFPKSEKVFKIREGTTPINDYPIIDKFPKEKPE